MMLEDFLAIVARWQRAIDVHWRERIYCDRLVALI